MRIEFHVYTDKRHRLKMRRMRRAAARYLVSVLGYLLPAVEVAAAAALLFFMCCMDTENIGPVFQSYCITAIVLGACFFLQRAIRSEAVHP